MAASDDIPKNGDLASLVGHVLVVSASTTVEATQAAFARHDVNFLGVVDGERFVGACSRRELTESLGSRFGFALNARRPISEQLMPSPLLIRASMPLTEVFKGASARSPREFYDDVVLLEEDGRFLGMIAMHTLVRLQTEHLLGNIERVEASRREITEKNRQMEDDLRMAHEVQLALLPGIQAPHQAAGVTLQVGHRYKPAGEMSGDFFSLMRISDTATGILICDVMGHGVRSSLVTAMVRAMLEELRPVAGQPGALVTHLNRDLTRILRQTGGLIFVTAAYAVLDLQARELRYAQAGHPTPLRWDGVQGRRVPIACGDEAAGPALGLIDEFEYATCAEAFPVGSRLLLFTDGVTEAAAADGTEFGEARLGAILEGGAGRALDEVLDEILRQIGTFSGDRLGDDVCLVAAELLEGPPAGA